MLVELLTSVGHELDPESRRQAEAIAFEASPTPTDAGLDREASGSKEAAAVATGTSLSSAGTVRRIPVQGHVSPDEAEERRRKGREYLAKRNQEMMELQQKRKAPSWSEVPVPSSPTSFDGLVDLQGHLKAMVMDEQDLPLPPTTDLSNASVQEKVREIERCIAQPISAMGAFQLGSQIADPFGDEYAMDRSLTPRPLERPETPKPPVPPKIRFEEVSQEIPAVEVVSVDQARREPRRDDGELTYEEQLAIALSLSEAESSATAATVRRRQYRDEDDLRAAITASLREMDGQQAAHAIAHGQPLTPQLAVEDSQPLVDLRSSNLPAPVATRSSRSDWETFFAPQSTPFQQPLPRAQPPPSISEDSDDLYRLTPELTRARLETHNAQHVQPQSNHYDPAREATGPSTEQIDLTMESSFYSAPSLVVSSQLIDASVTPALLSTSPQAFSTPASESSSVEFHSGMSEFASAPISRIASVTQPPPRSETSTVEVLDAPVDSDADMLSDEEGDGILTPDSWTEVGSRDGESDVEDEQPRWGVVV